jgi:hypothetical protein
MDGLGKWLVILGLGIVAVGGILWVAESAFGAKLGRLPGDIAVERDGFKLHIPIVTMLLVSAAGTLILWLISNLRR